MLGYGYPLRRFSRVVSLLLDSRKISARELYACLYSNSDTMGKLSAKSEQIRCIGI